MGCTEPGPGVPMKVLVERYVITPCIPEIETVLVAENRATAIAIAEEQTSQSLGQILGCSVQCDVVGEREIVTQADGELVKGLHDQHVDRHPHRPAPVGVSTEQTVGRLARFVVDNRRPITRFESKGMLGVIARQTAHAVGRKKLGGVEHTVENAPQLVGRYQ